MATVGPTKTLLGTQVSREQTDKARVRAGHTELGAKPAGIRAATGAPSDTPVVRVARQPILNLRMHLIGYELLFRESDANAAMGLNDGDATATVIVDGLLDVGLLDLVGENVAYLNVSREYLLTVRPLPLPARHVVLELAEDLAVDDELLEVLEELVEQRFTIALDDFRVTPESERLLPYTQIVKVDVLEHAGQALEDLVDYLAARRPARTLIAENVETREEFDRCRALGFEAFQGNFFAAPSRLKQRRLPSRGLTALGAMASLNATDDLDELHRIITRDAGLSMRLLRYANSAYVALPRRVGSVQEALVWLGTRTVRRFALMVSLASTPDVPDVLLVTALVRAHMCQLLSGAGESPTGDSYFTVGLFSVADALADAPMQHVIEQLPLRHDIAAALLHGTGELGEVLTEVIAYQRGEFDAASALIRSHPNIAQIYREATTWADLSIRGLV